MEHSLVLQVSPLPLILIVNLAVNYIYYIISYSYFHPCPHSHYRCRPYVDHANTARHADNGMALEQTYKTHRVIIREWTCDIGFSEANAFGYWTNVLNPVQHQSMIDFRKQCIYEDLIYLAAFFKYTKQDVEDLWTGGGGAAAVDEECSDDEPSTPNTMPQTPNRESERKRLKATPVSIGGVKHAQKNLPKGCYNKVVQATGESGSTYVQFQPTPLIEGSDSVHKNPYQQYPCSYRACKKKIRTYCACESVEPGSRVTMYCPTHFAAHCAAEQ